MDIVNAQCAGLDVHKATTPAADEALDVAGGTGPGEFQPLLSRIFRTRFRSIWPCGTSS